MKATVVFTAIYIPDEHDMAVGDIEPTWTHIELEDGMTKETIAQRLAEDVAKEYTEGMQDDDEPFEYAADEFRVDVHFVLAGHCGEVQFPLTRL